MIRLRPFAFTLAAAGLLAAGLLAAAPSFAASESDDAKPKAIHKVPPAYPEDAQAERLEGTVVVRLEVDADGAVSGAEVVSGPEKLRQAALDATRQWRFESSERSFELDVTINFLLDGDGKKGGDGAA